MIFIYTGLIESNKLSCEVSERGLLAYCTLSPLLVMTLLIVEIYNI